MNKELNLEKLNSIEKKVGVTLLEDEELVLLETAALSGAPRYEFDFGVCMIFDFGIKELAFPWFDKFIKHANGEMLYKVSAMLSKIAKLENDTIYDVYSLKCLKRSAYRKNKDAIYVLRKIIEETRTNMN